MSAWADLSIRGLNSAKRVKRRYGAVITIEDPLARAARQLRFHKAPSPAHLILRFEDIDHAAPGFAVAEEGDIARALDFARLHQEKDLLIHCFAGISRSTALAYGVLADRLGPGKEAEALEKVFQIRPHACPNMLVVELADRVLRREGKLVETYQQAIDAKRPLLNLISLRRLHFLGFPQQYARKVESEPTPEDLRAGINS